jgi:hypothetical protein
MMEAVCTSETSVYFNETTRCYIPEAIIFNKLKRFNNICGTLKKTVKNEAGNETDEIL